MATIITTTVSPVLAALFVATDAAQTVAETHLREVVDAAASGLPGAERTKLARENDALNNAWAQTQYDIAQFPAETMCDLKTKLGFMIEQTMGDGMDWLPTILEDVYRIEPAETPDWSEALRLYEQTTAANVAAITALSGAEKAHGEDPHVEAVRALGFALVRQDETSAAQTAALNALLETPAPHAPAMLVKMQIAIDTGMAAGIGPKDPLAVDLRRFSNYADQEA